MDRVNIVCGETGEYEDRYAWEIAAFSSPRRADTWARRANQWARVNGAHEDNMTLVGWDERYALEDKNPYDPNMRISYTGVRYFVIRGLALDPPLPR